MLAAGWGMPFGQRRLPAKAVHVPIMLAVHGRPEVAVDVAFAVPPALGERNEAAITANVGNVLLAIGDYRNKVKAIYGVVTSLAMDNKRGLVGFAVQHADSIMEPSGCVFDRAR